MKKQPERTEQTKAALIKAFWEIYKVKPIAKITVKEVTDKAGYYRSTFYFYFTNIYAIQEHIENNILQDWKSMVYDLEHGEHHLLLEKVAEFYEHNGEYMSVMLGQKGDIAFLQKIKDTIRPITFSHLDISANNAEASLIFEFLISAMLSFLTEWYQNARHIPAKDAVALLQSLASENIPSVMLRYTKHNAKSD